MGSTEKFTAQAVDSKFKGGSASQSGARDLEADILECRSPSFRSLDSDDADGEPHSKEAANDVAPGEGPPERWFLEGTAEKGRQLLQGPPPEQQEPPQRKRQWTPPQLGVLGPQEPPSPPTSAPAGIPETWQQRRQLPPTLQPSSWQQQQPEQSKWYPFGNLLEPSLEWGAVDREGTVTESAAAAAAVVSEGSGGGKAVVREAHLTAMKASRPEEDLGEDLPPHLAAALAAVAVTAMESPPVSSDSGSSASLDPVHTGLWYCYIAFKAKEIREVHKQCVKDGWKVIRQCWVADRLTNPYMYGTFSRPRSVQAVDGRRSEELRASALNEARQVDQRLQQLLHSQPVLQQLLQQHHQQQQPHHQQQQQQQVDQLVRSSCPQLAEEERTEATRRALQLLSPGLLQRDPEWENMARLADSETQTHFYERFRSFLRNSGLDKLPCRFGKVFKAAAVGLLLLEASSHAGPSCDPRVYECAALGLVHMEASRRVAGQPEYDRWHWSISPRRLYHIILYDTFLVSNPEALLLLGVSDGGANRNTKARLASFCKRLERFSPEYFTHLVDMLGDRRGCDWLMVQLCCSEMMRDWVLLAPSLQRQLHDLRLLLLEATGCLRKPAPSPVPLPPSQPLPPPPPQQPPPQEQQQQVEEGEEGSWLQAPVHEQDQALPLLLLSPSGHQGSPELKQQQQQQPLEGPEGPQLLMADQVLQPQPQVPAEPQQPVARSEPKSQPELVPQPPARPQLQQQQPQTHVHQQHELRELQLPDRGPRPKAEPLQLGNHSPSVSAAPQECSPPGPMGPRPHLTQPPLEPQPLPEHPSDFNVVESVQPPLPLPHLQPGAQQQASRSQVLQYQSQEHQAPQVPASQQDLDHQEKRSPRQPPMLAVTAPQPTLQLAALSLQPRTPQGESRKAPSRSDPQPRLPAPQLEPQPRQEPQALEKTQQRHEPQVQRQRPQGQQQQQLQARSERQQLQEVPEPAPALPQQQQGPRALHSIHEESQLQDRGAASAPTSALLTPADTSAVAAAEKGIGDMKSEVKAATGDESGAQGNEAEVDKGISFARELYTCLLRKARFLTPDAGPGKERLCSVMAVLRLAAQYGLLDHQHGPDPAARLVEVLREVAAHDVRPRGSPQWAAVKQAWQAAALMSADFLSSRARPVPYMQLRGLLRGFVDDTLHQSRWADLAEELRPGLLQAHSSSWGRLLLSRSRQPQQPQAAKPPTLMGWLWRGDSATATSKMAAGAAAATVVAAAATAAEREEGAGGGMELQSKERHLLTSYALWGLVVLRGIEVPLEYLTLASCLATGVLRKEVMLKTGLELDEAECVAANLFRGLAFLPPVPYLPRDEPWARATLQPVPPPLPSNLPLHHPVRQKRMLEELEYGTRLFLAEPEISALLAERVMPPQLSLPQVPPLELLLALLLEQWEDRELVAERCMCESDSDDEVEVLEMEVDAKGGTEVAGA
ncbi:hypothetical protein VOLCADRAFT_98772 [Volvox carteri f. nagariensis]|uniref:Uncharacterized protein n=1 Tax=Volvox carteri f. nagariensis TaxID=3068 RepID=D8UG93_VOLCA|nr:uncharacterized protein VOLCADRAFT_98772 [Volvox carteri f. nagariensis]EFJ41220.1 hypothetical protein VOLCADRAFT_98772 [Volvox carteri f. nagariensis]|eukprot:XP_002957671.1 hypothetical protein VOLCADRAFT_98772 [Volvox carteri f. nagariensis]